MNNILFSTTRQWNPGDEFILYGVLNLYHEKYGEFNPIIYNRNPAVCPGHPIFSNEFKRKMYKMVSTFPYRKDSFLNLLKLNTYDNSMKFIYNIPDIELCVFAGTPEWNQKRIKPLYEYLNKHKIPCVYLGIGSSDNDTMENIVRRCGKALTKSRLITVRDKYTLNLLKSYGARYIPCPSLLSSTAERIVKRVNKVGLIYGTDKAVPANRISKETHSFILDFYQKLANRFDVEIVCHYIDEISEAKREFPNISVRYSYNSYDYVEIYGKYDMVIGPRIHGIGISASMGIPGIAIKHDMRGNTAEGFKAKILDFKKITVDDALQQVDDTEKHIECLSKEIIQQKVKVKQQYLKLI